MAKKTYELLGIYGDREFWTDPESGDIFCRIPSIREAIRAAPGYRIFSADYSQIEVKIMAFLSQDPWLIAAINSKKDIHSFMCCEINGIEYDFFYDVLKEQYTHPDCAKYNRAQLAALTSEFSIKRGETKCVTFGLPYGAGIPTIAANIRNKEFRFPDGSVGLEPRAIVEKRAEKLMENYFGKAHVLKGWLNEQKRLAVEEGRTYSVLDRSRWYVPPDPDDPDRNQKIAAIGREAGNQPIQSSNADILKVAVDLTYNAYRDNYRNGPVIYPGTRLQLVVHDEIVGTAPERYVFSGDVAKCEAILANPKAPTADKLAALGPAPLKLKESMEQAYNSVAKEINGQMCYLKDIWNKVDIVVGHYWSKD